MVITRAHPVKTIPKKECRSCKYYEKGKCRLFVDRIAKNEIVFVDADVLRADENSCGPKGLFWAASDFDPDQILYSDTPFW